jgi:putative intracellular protease/amidase
MKIGVLLADGFQDSEYFLPKFDIENTGSRTEVISLDSKPIAIYSYFSRIGTLDIDKTISNADPGDYDGVLVPGGAKSPAILAESDEVLSFLRRISSGGRLVASICRGSLLVARSGIAEGRHLTGFHLASEYPELVIRPIVEKYGGIWRDDQPVVVDGNLISSRHPSDMPHFSRAIREWLGTKEMTMEPERLLYRAYAAFNARDIDAALALLHADVAWPNGMEGGMVHGHDGVRAYWTRQWTIVNPHVEPLSIVQEAEGLYVAKVHQVVKDLQGAILTDRIVHHAYRFQNGKVTSMEIRE